MTSIQHIPASVKPTPAPEAPVVLEPTEADWNDYAEATSEARHEAWLFEIEHRVWPEDQVGEPAEDGQEVDSRYHVSTHPHLVDWGDAVGVEPAHQVAPVSTHPCLVDGGDSSYHEPIATVILAENSSWWAAPRGEPNPFRRYLMTFYGTEGNEIETRSFDGYREARDWAAQIAPGAPVVELDVPVVEPAEELADVPALTDADREWVLLTFLDGVAWDQEPDPTDLVLNTMSEDDYFDGICPEAESGRGVDYLSHAE